MKRFARSLGLAATIIGVTACTNPTGPESVGRIEGKQAAQLHEALAQNTDGASNKAEHVTAYMTRKYATGATYQVTARINGRPVHYEVSIDTVKSGFGKDMTVTPVAQVLLEESMPIEEANAYARTQVTNIVDAYDQEAECKEDLAACLAR